MALYVGAFERQFANHLARYTADVDRHLERLASGLRINSPGDDPAGLMRSERVRARSRSTSQAVRNVGDAIGLVHTLESGLAQMGAIGARLHGLSIQAANGTTSVQDLAVLNAERERLAEELTYIAETTEFNGRSLMNVQETIGFQIGIEAQDVLGLDLIDFSPVGVVFAYYSFDSEEDLEDLLSYSQVLVDTMAQFQGFVGTVERRLQQVLSGLRRSEEQLSAEAGGIRDADFAVEVSGLESARIKQSSALLVLAHARVQGELARELLEDIRELRAELPAEADEEGESSLLDWKEA